MALSASTTNEPHCGNSRYLFLTYHTVHQRREFANVDQFNPNLTQLKNKAAALTSYDADNDGAADLICTFGGRFEARHWQTGDIIFKSEKARQEIAAITSADWLNSGCHQLVVCSRTGNSTMFHKSLAK